MLSFAMGVRNKETAVPEEFKGVKTSENSLKVWLRMFVVSTLTHLSANVGSCYTLLRSSVPAFALQV